jgi:beta-glucosidase
VFGLLLLGAAACGDENNYYQVVSEEPPAPPPLDCSKRVYADQPVIGAHTDVTGKAVLTVDGKQFKDLSGDGKLDPYEDWRLLEICRALDLVSKMTVPQKVGLMSNASYLGTGTADGSIPDSVRDLIVVSHVRQALIRFGTRTGQELAVYLNAVQDLSESQPLGIPFLVNADPAHSISFSTAANGSNSLSAGTVLSHWPQTLGLGAINDQATTRLYGDTVRREFMAMGFRWQLGPMADLASEPRWGRIPGTFGSNGLAVANHVEACVEGFQGVGDGGLRNGIAATMKHFPGHGPNEDGKDSHTYAGRFNVYPGNNFAYHAIPFKAAIDVGVAATMPCYSIFKDQWDVDPLQVGAAFSKEMITDYLKDELGFTGMVTSDWGTMSMMPHGVEALTQPERAAMFVKAGSHQLGLDSFTIVQAAYDQGLLTEDEIEEAAGKILEMSFKLGMFENPYVDAAAAPAIVKSAESRTNGFEAQKKAIVLLKNREHTTVAASAAKYLPVGGARFTDANGNGTPDPGEYVCDTDGDGQVEVYYDGVVDGIVADPTKPDGVTDVFGEYDYTSAGGGVVLPVVAVASLAEADIAIIRIAARSGPRGDAGVPLSFDAPYTGDPTAPGFPPGASTADTGIVTALVDRNKVIDAFRVRDGWVDSTGATIAAAKPTLKIVLMMGMGRPGIVRPFVNGLTTLDETPGVPGSYPLVSSAANIRVDGLGGVDAFLVEFGAYDRAVLDFLFDVNAPTGFVYGTARLPLEIPSSDADVEAQFEDLPNDTWSPTYAVGAGMTY